MSIISRMRRQFAVYWAPTTADAYGRPGLAAPIEIRCRWEDVTEQFIAPATGTIELSRAKVYTDRQVLLGGFLWRGRIEDLPALDVNLRTLAGASAIKRFDSLPNIKASEYLLTAML